MVHDRWRIEILWWQEFCGKGSAVFTQFIWLIQFKQVRVFSLDSSWSADWNRGQATFPRFSWFQLYSLGFSVELGLWTKELMWEKDMRTPHLLATVRCFILQIFRFEGFETSSLQITAVTGFSFALLEACPVLRHLKGASNALSHSRHSRLVCFRSCLSRCATRWASFGSSISWSHACASCQRWVRQIEGPERVYSGKWLTKLTKMRVICMMYHDVFDPRRSMWHFCIYFKVCISDQRSTCATLVTTITTRIPFREKILWTGISLFVFLVCCQIPILGIWFYQAE